MRLLLGYQLVLRYGINNEGFAGLSMRLLLGYQLVLRYGIKNEGFAGLSLKILTMDCLDPLSSSGGAFARSLGSKEGKVGMSHSSSGGVQ